MRPSDEPADAWGSAEPAGDAADGDAAEDAAAEAEAEAAEAAARAAYAASSRARAAAAAASVAAPADPRDPRRPLDARWQKPGASWAPPRDAKEEAEERESGDMFLTLGSALGGIGMWLKVLPLCWAALVLALVSLGSRRADGSYKLQQFVMALVFGAVGVATIILGEYRPAAAAAIAARPNPLYGLLKGVGLPVDAALGSVNQMLKAVGLK
jgi:hypothetical protein